MRSNLLFSIKILILGSLSFSQEICFIKELLDSHTHACPEPSLSLPRPNLSPYPTSDALPGRWTVLLGVVVFSKNKVFVSYLTGVQQSLHDLSLDRFSACDLRPLDTVTLATMIDFDEYICDKRSKDTGGVGGIVDHRDIPGTKNIFLSVEDPGKLVHDEVLASKRILILTEKPSLEHGCGRQITGARKVVEPVETYFESIPRDTWVCHVIGAILKIAKYA